jgi:hypothetical protein
VVLLVVSPCPFRYALFAASLAGSAMFLGPTL